MVYIDGKTFIKDDQPIRFKGLNLGNWLMVEAYMIGLPWTETRMRAEMRKQLGFEKFSAFWDTFVESSLTAADFEFMKSLGLNCVQIPLNYRHFIKDGTAFGYTHDGFELLDRVVDLCGEYDMPGLISLHAAPGAQVRDWNAESDFGEALLWQHDCFIDQTAEFWSCIASRYEGNPSVLGYEVLNEPLAEDFYLFNSFNERMLQSIREADSEHVVIFSFDKWGREFDSLDESLFDDPQVTASFHSYITQIEPFGRLHEYPGEYEGKMYGKDEMLGDLRENISEFPYDRPLFCGECGISLGDEVSRDARTAMQSDQLFFFNDEGISWTMWCYKDLKFLGLLHPGPETPWARFQKREDIQKLRSSYSRTVSPYFSNIKEHIPVLSEEDIMLFSTQTRHVYDSVVLPHAVELLDEFSAEELREMALSFSFENSMEEKPKIDLIRRFTQ